jgi:hypothetical protein
MFLNLGSNPSNPVFYAVANERLDWVPWLCSLTSGFFILGGFMVASAMGVFLWEDPPMHKFMRFLHAFKLYGCTNVHMTCVLNMYNKIKKESTW